MAIFRSENLDELLRDKYVLLLGDSVQRSVYKDLVVLCHDNRFIAQSELKKKGEESFLDDKLVFRSELTNGTNYREVREFKKNGFHFKFHFITRVYNDYVESILKEMEDGDQPFPDILILNSCLWDISRYGRSSMEVYKKNLVKLCKRLEKIFPTDALIIWRTTLPVSEEMKGGFLTADAEWCRSMLSLDMLRANYFAYNIVNRFNYDILDMHYHFRFQLHRQARDGVHWNMYAHRRMTNILLSHIAQAWNIQIPELPWADDSKIDFTEDDVALNTTAVLKQAYEPHKLKPCIWTKSSKKCSEPTSQKLYTSFYDIPEEEQEVDEHGDYQLLPHEPTILSKVTLPTDPYPEWQNDNPPVPMNPVLEMDKNWNSGPIRNSRKKSSRYRVYQPRKTSEMLKIRLSKEKAKDRQVVIEKQPSFKQQRNRRDPHNWRSVARPSQCKPYQREVHQWSHFSRHNPVYGSHY